MNEILITGATGNVGGEIVKVFARENRLVVATVSDLAKTRGRFPESIELRELDFKKAETFQTALRNIRQVFLMLPPGLGSVRQTIFPFIKSCQNARVEQIVLLSVQGAERAAILPHRKVEREILRLQIPHTFLRPSYFNQNFLVTHRDEIKFRNEIFVPAGRGRTSFVDVRDVAEVAFKAFFDSHYLNKEYELTGTEALNYYEIADIFSGVLGKQVKYTNPSLIRFIWRGWRERRNLPFVLIMAMLYTSARFGRAAHLTNDLEVLLARLPISFEQFVADYAETWIV